MKSSLTSLVLLLVATSASALEWPTQELTIKAAALDRTAQTAFAFTNKSDKTVTIRSVDTSCDCLDAKASAKTFAPGASGTINARFTLGGRFGTYSRTIIVSTDDGQEPAALRVTIEIPEVATLTPRVVDWKLNAVATEQTVAIEVTPGVELTINDVQPTSEDFTFRLETVTAGHRYLLHVTPKSMARVANAAFRLSATTATDHEMVFSAYANVR